MITCLLLYLLVGFLMHKAMGWRGDGTPNLPNRVPEHWPGLNHDDFSFRAGKWVLRGSRYHFGPGPYKGLIVFFHGISAGHTAYLSEIVTLAQAGYLVYAYDYRGCMLSEGRDMRTLSQPVEDADAFFHWLDGDPSAQGLTRYSCGHSWGGYVALTSLRPDYHIAKVVSISGFAEPMGIISGLAPQINFLGPLIKLYCRQVNGRFANVSGLDLMKATSVPVLYIQGTDDPFVDYEKNGHRFQSELAGHGNVHFIFLQGRGHNCYWTAEAEAYYKDCLAKHITSVDRDPSLSMDLDRVLQDDPKTWGAIIDFLEA